MITPVKAAKMFESGVAPAALIPGGTPMSAAHATPQLSEADRIKAEKAAKARQLEEYAALHVAQEEERRRRTSQGIAPQTEAVRLLCAPARA